MTYSTDTSASSTLSGYRAFSVVSCIPVPSKEWLGICFSNYLLTVYPLERRVAVYRFLFNASGCIPNRYIYR